MLTAPAFWYRQKSKADVLLKKALMPLSIVYGALVRKKFDLYFPVPMAKPIICVGNLTAGGAGKTPVVLSLVDLLKEKGLNPHLLTMGYGGHEKGPIQVAPSRDTAYDVGDEALLLVEKAPTWVSHRRVIGAQSAIDTGADIVVLDDGYQNAVIYKDFSLLVVDGGVGFGNRAVMPAGPLREPLNFGISRADAFVIIGEDKTGVADYIRRLTQAPVLFASLVPDENNPDINGKKIYAFAGIGRPMKFKETLDAAGAMVEGWAEFPDHHPYDEEDLQEIIKAATAQDAPLITTVKDYVRVPASLRPRVQKFAVHLVWRDKDEIVALIEQAVRKRHSQK
jgi:tetraacyldisaccharide 4'-kinase